MFKSLPHYLFQIPGWHTSRKIIVIESDDWGSIRMPSGEIYKDLLGKGLSVDKCAFSRYDSLERSDDLSALFDVLVSVKDKNGNPAVITADSVVANPDFERIEKCDFQNYYYEIVIDTFKKYNGCEKSYDLYLDGIKNKVWHPQFHGREHLNVLRWMKALQANDEITRLAFEQKHFGLSNKVSPKLKVRYMDAFANIGLESLQKESIIIKEGTEIFEKLYGYRSKSFIAPCYTWCNELEPVLKECGIEYIQGLALQQIPVSDNPLKCKSKFHYTGEKNNIGQRYLVRNAFFEPYKGESIDHVGECLKRIEIAFKCHKPAIISSHRINFIGAIDSKNRDNNLKLFKELLLRIIQKWPEVEFTTSDKLGDLIV